MDIIKAFESNNATMHITLRGTHEEPLFRASDIGEVLEITHIRTSIQDFDHTEKHGVRITDTIGREQETTFLTEKGLYKLLFKSRKPIAKKFTDWVCEVIKEIRLNGKYQLEQQVTEVTKQLELKDKEMTNSKEITLLETFKNSRGVYLAFVNHKKTEVKFGHGSIQDRVKMHKKEIGNEFSLQYVIETQYDRELESLIKTKLKHLIISKKFPNRKAKCTELIKIDECYTIEHLYNDILKLKKTLKDDLIKSQQITIKNLQQQLKKYENIESEDSEQLEESEQEEEEIKLQIVKKIPGEKRKMPIALTEKLKKKVYKFSIDSLSLVETFDSIAKAAEHEKIAPVSISQRIRMGTNIDGFVWSFDNTIPRDFFSTKNTIIYKFDSDLNLLETFRSVAEASRKENIAIAKIQRLARTNTIIDGILYSKTNDINKINIKLPKSVNSKQVNKIDFKTGKIIKTYESSTEAAIEAGVNQSAISRRIKNKVIVGGFLFKYVDTV